MKRWKTGQDPPPPHLDKIQKNSSKKVTSSKTNRRRIIIYNPLVKILRNVRDCTSGQPWWKRETSRQLAGTKQPHGVTKLLDWWGNGVWLYLGWFAFRESKGCSVTSHAPQVGQYWIQFQIISVMFHFWQFIYLSCCWKKMNAKHWFICSVWICSFEH